MVVESNAGLRKSKTPTWVGHVLSDKDERIKEIKELSDAKVTFMVERLAAEYEERQKRSEALYNISEQRAADMREALEDKDRTIKRLWIVVVIQVFAIIVLAGASVTGKIPMIGDIKMNPASEKGSD